jgi:hypothetical protein
MKTRWSRLLAVAAFCQWAHLPEPRTMKCSKIGFRSYLPLPIAPQSGIAADPIGELKKLLPTTLDQSLANAALQASSRGAKAVQQELKRRLTAPFTDAVKKLGESGEEDE